MIWLDVPIEAVTHKKLGGFIDHLQGKRLKPKTINCYLDSIRGFYDYLIIRGTATDAKSGKARRYAANVQAAAAVFA